MITILVIEDDELIRANILEILEIGNFKAVGAENGRLGVRLARKIAPDLIICDVTMPELDGYGVLEALRQDPFTSIIPFIFLTALADRENNRKGMESGADDYIIKPCRPEELLKAIATRLGKQTAITGLYTTALKQASQQLNQYLRYDRVTKLANRLLLEEKFNQILDSLNSSITKPTLNNSDKPISILYLSLNRFNMIVESLGYSKSDLLLQIVAQKLQVFTNCCHIIARLRDAEFAIVLVNNKKAVINLVKKILDEIALPLKLDSLEPIVITASIGIASYPSDGKNLEELLQSANSAMGYAKQLGGNAYQFHKYSFKIKASERLALEASLSYALEREEFKVYYQPKVSLLTGRIVGAEALLRWFHSERGVIPPNKFIPIAEESNQIIPLGEWVLKTACQQTKLWQDSGFPYLRIAVNLSGCQFNQSNLYSKLLEILIETGFNANYLELELTESVLMKNPEVGAIKLNAFKALGVKIAIDDFGTGYSSLNYIQNFSFDILKLDKCFVSKLNQDKKSIAIAKAIIQMGHALNLNLVAEGVETEAELNFLCQNNCDEMQGYLFSQPVSAKDFERLLISEKSLALP